MAATRQIINTTINLPAAAFVNPDNTTRALVKPVLYAGNETLFTCQLLGADGLAQPLHLATEFYATLDSSFEPDAAPLAATVDDRFNDPADWSGLDLAAGKFCFTLSAATAEIITELRGRPSALIHFEVWFRVPGGEWATLLHESITVHNTSATFEPETIAGVTYLTTADLPALNTTGGIEVETLAALPADPSPGQSAVVNSLGYTVYWQSARGLWANALGVEVTAEDEI